MSDHSRLDQESPAQASRRSGPMLKEPRGPRLVEEPSGFFYFYFIPISVLWGSLPYVGQSY